MVFSTFGTDQKTGIDINLAKELASQSIVIPDGFTVHDSINKYFIDKRKQAIERNELDWATAVNLF